MCVLGTGNGHKFVHKLINFLNSILYPSLDCVSNKRATLCSPFPRMVHNVQSIKNVTECTYINTINIKALILRCVFCTLMYFMNISYLYIFCISILRSILQECSKFIYLTYPLLANFYMKNDCLDFTYI